MTAVTYVRPGTPADEAAVAVFERALGFQLPAEYRRYLLEVGGGALEANVLRSDERVGVQALLELGSSLEARRRTYAERVPHGFLPIADDGCGNLLLLALGGRERGSVWFWDHEQEAEEGEPATRDNLTRVADSVRGLLGGLRPHGAGGEAGGVVSAWIDPDLLREHGGR